MRRGGNSSGYRWCRPDAADARRRFGKIATGSHRRRREANDRQPPVAGKRLRSIIAFLPRWAPSSEVDLRVHPSSHRFSFDALYRTQRPILRNSGPSPLIRYRSRVLGLRPSRFTVCSVVNSVDSSFTGCPPFAPRSGLDIKVPVPVRPIAAVHAPPPYFTGKHRAETVPSETH